MEEYINNMDVENINPEQVEQLGDTISSIAPTIMLVIAIAIVAIIFLARYKKNHKQVTLERGGAYRAMSRTAFAPANFAIMYNNEDVNADYAQYLKVFDNKGVEVAEYREMPGQKILGVYEDNGQLCMRTSENYAAHQTDWVWDPTQEEFVEYRT